MPQPTPSERVNRAMANAADLVPPAVEGPRDDDIPVAATVVLARDTDRGPEVLMIERPDRGSFAGAWVFPGGKLEEGDRTGPDESEEDVARRAGVRETFEETGLTLDVETLTAFSCWTPPPGIALRIRTWFFLAAAPADVSLALSAHEAVWAGWVRPADVLERHGRGEVTLYPPTWITLHDLSQQSDVDDLLAMARLGGVRRFETAARRGPNGPMMLWREDADYDADASVEASGTPDAPRRHRLDLGVLPWVYERSTD